MTNSPKVLRDGLTRGLYMSHGTLEIRDFSKSKAFFREVLGIEAYRHSPQSMFIRKNAYMTVACVQTEEASVDQGYENRWGVDVDSAEEVDRSYKRLLVERDRYGVQELLPPSRKDMGYSFALRDLNGNWWEVQHADKDPASLFDAATPSEH